jgi:hypothetical protein
MTLELPWGRPRPSAEKATLCLVKLEKGDPDEIFSVLHRPLIRASQVGQTR